VNNIFVHGDSLQDYLVAVIDIDLVAAGNLIRESKIELSTKFWELGRLSINENVECKKVILTELQKFVKSKGLSSLEVVKNMHISEEPFSVENNMLTPTMKLKRFHMTKHYANELAALYTQGPVIASQSPRSK